MRNKIRRLLIHPVMLLFGLAAGHYMTANNSIASDTCNWSYCNSGDCVSNQNATSCTSATGTLPCSGHANCATDPANEDSQF